MILDKKSLLNIDFKNTILKSIVNKKSVTHIRQIIADSAVKDFSVLFTFLYENVEKISKESADIVLLVIAQYQYQDAMVVDKEINFAAMISALKEKI